MVFERINNNEHLDYLGKILKADKFDIVYNHDNDETHRDVYSKKTQEYLNIVATNKTPIWDSEQKKFVAEEDREEKETASLSEEINMMRTETSKSFEEDYDDESDTTTIESTSLDGDDDELPF